MAADSVQKKAAAAAAARNKKGGKNWKVQYGIWIGGSVGSIVLALIIFIINPERGPFGTMVNDPSQIAHINRNAKGWQAEAAPFFEGWSVGDVKLLEGVGISQMAGGLAPCQTGEIQVPDNFDARDKWSKCFNTPIYSMGNCTASWALATASTFSDRACISDPETNAHVVYSPQQLLSCDQTNKGCNGGDIDSAWGYVQREGLVSEACFPYQADSSISCDAKCSEDVPKKSAGLCMLNNEVDIMKEIFTNGPVVAPVFLVDDFLVYKKGLYKETATSSWLTGFDNRRTRIVHAVKVLGWGVEKKRKYWLIENSWGQEWGEGGYAKIARGGDPEKKEGIIIETFMVAGSPASEDLKEPDDDDEIDLDPSEDSKDDDDE